MTDRTDRTYGAGAGSAAGGRRDEEELMERLRLAPRFDAGRVLEGEEIGWFGLLERARITGADPALSHLDDRELVAELGRRSARIAASMCAYLELVAELTVRGVWADHGARTPGQWLSYELGVGASTAADHIRVGLRLRELPRIREQFAAGRLSYSKVRAITRIAVPEIEELLVTWSQHATGAEVERIISAFRSTCRPEAGAPDGQRGFRSRRNGDGTTTITLRLPDDEAAAIEANLDRLIDLDETATGPADETATRTDDQAATRTDDQAARANDATAPREPSSAEDAEPPPEPTSTTDPTPPPDPTRPPDPTPPPHATPPPEPTPSSAEDAGGLPPPLSLDELVALDAAGAGGEFRHPTARRSGPSSAEDDGPGPVLPVHRTRSAKRADALVHAVAAAAAAGGVDTSGMDRHMLVLRADVADLAGTSDLDDGSDRQLPVESPSGRVRTMSAQVMRRLACEAGVTLVATDGRLPIDVGRLQRRPTAAQRRALMVRDRTCRFPGCGAHRHLHAHHVVHWADGGPTDLANLVMICGFHHRFVHEHRWDVTPAAAGTFRFAPPDGDPLPTICRDDALTPVEDHLVHAPDSPGGADAPDGPGNFGGSGGSGGSGGLGLRPVDHVGPGNLDLHLAVEVLHQELRGLLPLVDYELAS